jgi:hypothetical protein
LLSRGTGLLNRADIENMDTIFDFTDGEVKKIVINNVLTDGVATTVKGAKSAKKIGEVTEF